METALHEALKAATSIAAEACTSAEEAAEGARLQSPGGLGTVQLKTVVSQGTDETVPKLSKEELAKHFDAFRRVFRRAPPPHEERSGEQLRGVHSLLKRDMAPIRRLRRMGAQPPSVAEEAPLQKELCFRAPARSKRRSCLVRRTSKHGATAGSLSALPCWASTPYV